MRHFWIVEAEAIEQLDASPPDQGLGAIEEPFLR
jgi:hypothetical protein